MPGYWNLAWGARNNVVIPQDNPRVPVQFDHSGAEFQTNYVNDAGGVPEAELGFGGIALHISRIWNPKVKTFKGLKNNAGLNNNDNMYLPRIVRFMPRRTASARSVQYLSRPKFVQSAGAIRSVFVAPAELR